MQTRTFQHTVTREDQQANTDATTLLAKASELSRSAIKDAMGKGAVWLKRGKAQTRQRRATFVPRAGDVLVLHYNPDILQRKPPVPELLADEKQYSVWIKPAGLLAQGSPEGDHCSLLRLAEQQLGREVKLVHRLDREAAGLMLIAHSAKAASAFSALFARDKGDSIGKTYQVKVKGQVAAAGEIALPLDGKHALTRYRLLAADSHSSWLEIDLITGRKHQIRRHLAAIGHPVMGDPQYGNDNQDKAGLQLFAVALEFVCPLTRVPKHFRWTIQSP